MISGSMRGSTIELRSNAVRFISRSLLSALDVELRVLVCDWRDLDTIRTRHRIEGWSHVIAPVHHMTPDSSYPASVLRPDGSVRKADLAPEHPLALQAHRGCGPGRTNDRRGSRACTPPSGPAHRPMLSVRQKARPVSPECSVDGT